MRRRGSCWSQTRLSWSANMTSSCSAVCSCNGFPWVLSIASAWASFPSLGCHWTSEYWCLRLGKVVQWGWTRQGSNHIGQFSPVSWKNAGKNSAVVVCWLVGWLVYFIYLFIYLSIYLFFLLWPHPQQVEVSRLGVKSDLQLPASTTATATGDLSRICEPYHSSQQCWISNPLSKVRD